ncbi:hypothetical protein SAMN04487939_104296 [Lysobacter sp. yr284]|uniref:hypothetical protein n=1 Tax=Lysobacter sp. yr284 TaxID=1761791 RepID=UPI000894CB70|nr:hypothetical protein [Lysobacter sp. yr284]SDY65876.1 hypothetical protein SAMN04487939_104296 [Lysobacter sp. yr284]
MKLDLLGAVVAAIAFVAPHACGARENTAPRGDWLPAPPVLRSLCLRPYSQTVVVRLPSGYSGYAGSFSWGSRYLRVDKVTARLHQPGMWAADLGGTSANEFGWYPMRMDGSSAVYASAVDGAIYLDPNTSGSVVLYRRGTGAPGSGEFTVEGCRVDQRPEPTLRPEIVVPHLPREFPWASDRPASLPITGQPVQLRSR